jgi:hypothetical protein
VLSDLYGEVGVSYVNQEIPLKIKDIVFKDKMYVICHVAQFERLYRAGCLEDPSETSSDIATVSHKGLAVTGMVVDLTHMSVDPLLTVNLFVLIIQKQASKTLLEDSKIRLLRAAISPVPDQSCLGGSRSGIQGQLQPDVSGIQDPLQLGMPPVQGRVGDQLQKDNNTKDSENIAVDDSNEIVVKVVTGGCAADVQISKHNLIPKILLPGNADQSPDMLTKHNIQFSFRCLRQGCGFKTNSKITFHLHVKFIHAKKPLLHVCQCCKMEFSSLHDLSNHVAEHITDASTIPADILKKLDFVSSDAVQEISICGQCGECLTERVDFLNHVTYHSHMVWPCSDCGKRMRSKHELWAHVQFFHDFEKPFMCEVCFLRFATYSWVSHHRRKFHISS